MYVQEVSEHDDEKLMKRFASGELAQKEVRFGEGAGQVQYQGHVLGATRIRRRLAFTPKGKRRKKTGGLWKKDSIQNSAIQVLGECVERYEFLNSLAKAPARIKFGQIANGDVDKVRKELPKISPRRLQSDQLTLPVKMGSVNFHRTDDKLSNCRYTLSPCTDSWTQGLYQTLCRTR